MMGIINPICYAQQRDPRSFYIGFRGREEIHATQMSFAFCIVYTIESVAGDLWRIYYMVENINICVRFTVFYAQYVTEVLLLHFRISADDAQVHHFYNWLLARGPRNADDGACKNITN